MACSKYEYVKQYEEHRVALHSTYIVIRVDGRGFTKFCSKHNFHKPNDRRALELMNRAAHHVCEKFQDIFLAYGQSDEYSFAFVLDTELFNRRIDKIQTCVVSAFSSAYVYFWNKHFPEMVIKDIPSFDARAVLYPNLTVLKDYFRWRQVDCHINNLYNTVFWCLRGTGMSTTEVENKLKDTNSGDKNQILFSQFDINYNTIEPIYRKGTIICYKQPPTTLKRIPTLLHEAIKTVEKLQKNTEKILKAYTKQESEQQHDIQQLATNDKQLSCIQERYKKILQGNSKKSKIKHVLEVVYEDLIQEDFWATIRI